jgi:hypothetical protein
LSVLQVLDEGGGLPLSKMNPEEVKQLMENINAQS